MSPRSRRLTRRVAAGILAASVAATLAACGGDDDGDDNTATTTDSDGTSVPRWPSSVDIINGDESEVQNLVDERALSVYEGDCDVLTDDMTQALQRISWQAGNKSRDEYGDAVVNDWGAIKVTASEVSTPGSSDPACQYDITDMTIGGIPNQVNPAKITRITVGALPEDKNTFTPDEDARFPNGEEKKPTLDDLSYAPIAKVGAGVVENMDGVGDNYGAFMTEGNALNDDHIGTYLGAAANGEMFALLTAAKNGDKEVLSNSGWWIKVAGESEARGANISPVTETVKRIYLGLLNPTDSIAHKTSADALKI